MTTSLQNTIRTTVRAVVFVAAVLVALLFSTRHAHAEDAAAQATPAPDPGTGSGGTPPTEATTPAPTTPPEVPPAPEPVAAPTPPPALPTGDVDPPGGMVVDHTIPPNPGTESATPPHAPIAGTGTQTTQTAGVTTGGTSVANTGANTAGSTGTPGGVSAAMPGGTTSGIDSGNATGVGSVDHSGISQTVNATVTENGHVVVVQVAIIVNIGIGLAGSGGNVAGAESATPPRPVSSIAMIVGNETAGAGGSGPTPARITTGGANATGNTGTTQVTQSIVLSGNDVASQLAAVLNLGVGVSNSGLNFALAAVTGNNSGSPSSVSFVTMGGAANIGTGGASALGNRSTSAVFQLVTVTASGNGSLLVVQRAIIVNFGLALANSGLNVAGGGALTGTLPNPAATQAQAQQLLLMLLSPDSATPGSGASGVSGDAGGIVAIGTGGAHAIGNDTTTGIDQTVVGSVTGHDTAQAIQDAWVGNFGIGIANSGANGAAAGLAGIDPSSLAAARSALQAFLAGLTGLGDPLQGLDGSFQLGSNLLQLHGDVSGTESLLGVSEPGTAIGPDDAAVIVRQVTAVLNIGLSIGDSGHNVATSTTSASGDTLVAGPGAAAVATTTIHTGAAEAVGNHFAASVCQAIGDTLACATPVTPSGPDTPPVVTPDPQPPTVISEDVFAPSFAPATAPSIRPAVIASTLPFTGSPIGAELAAGSGLLVAGMLMARRRRSEART